MYTKGDRTERFKLHQFDDAPMLDKWEIPACDVIINNRLGEGCFGSVYRGVIKGPINNPKLPSSLKNVLCPTVAIKFLKRESNCSEFKWHHNCICITIAFAFVMHHKCITFVFAFVFAFVMHHNHNCICIYSICKWYREKRFSARNWHYKESLGGEQPSCSESRGLCHHTGTSVSHHWVHQTWTPSLISAQYQRFGEQWDKLST